ncbi:4Fe-4S binding protein, partial [bacterium]|nr:4Fe-4S binding protein [bacterium]
MDDSPADRESRPSLKGGADRSPFPVFPGELEIAGPVKKSRMGRRRALVLGAVHLLILAHATHWLVTGSTVSPVEPSESMKTLELGEVNAGFVFLVLAILSSLVFGRFICGWACHLVALQDLCAWMMKKLGVRPRPFRSRLLVWAPVLLALYMFVWPTFRRVVAAPLLQRAGLPLFGAPAPFPGFESHLVTSEFWATFPTWWVAIPFLLLCGFGLVYLLGSK